MKHTMSEILSKSSGLREWKAYDVGPGKRFKPAYSSLSQSADTHGKQTAFNKNSAKHLLQAFLHLLNFNEIGCKQCNGNDLMASVFVTFKYRTLISAKNYSHE